MNNVRILLLLAVLLLLLLLTRILQTWACLRTLDTAKTTGQPTEDGKAAPENSIFCQFFEGFGGRNTSIPNFHEYYDLSTDKWQLRNGASALPKARFAALTARLQALMSCEGAECRAYRSLEIYEREREGSEV